MVRKKKSTSAVEERRHTAVYLLTRSCGRRKPLHVHVHLLPTPLGFGLPPILGQPRECFSILPVLYYSPQPWALQTQQSESPGCGLWPSLGCGHTHQVQSPASMESYFPATLRPTPGLCSLLTCFIFFFFKEKSFPLMQENLIMQ